MPGGEKPSAKPFVPETRALPALRDAVQSCRGCDLYRNATQAVFGEGAARAPILMVGEQPGDSEDRAGRPFVGPAGRVLRQAMEQAGLDRSLVYLTNSVKHFKFEERGKRRIHAKPRGAEIAACRPWLDAEIDTVQPRLLVALGATAAQALVGKALPVAANRGRFLEHPRAEALLVTVHPSFLLRVPVDQRDGLVEEFVADLRLAAGFVRR